MASAELILVGGVGYLIPACVCVLVMVFVRRRWLAWFIDSLVLLFATWLVLGTQLALSEGYLGGPHMSDLLVAWPVPVLLIALTFLSTRPRKPRDTECECGYDLTGNRSGVCPECGRRIDKPPQPQSD